jgi:hypothetical protein
MLFRQVADGQKHQKTGTEQDALLSLHPLVFNAYLGRDVYSARGWSNSAAASLKISDTIASLPCRLALIVFVGTGWPVHS